MLLPLPTRSWTANGGGKMLRDCVIYCSIWRRMSHAARQTVEQHNNSIFNLMKTSSSVFRSKCHENKCAGEKRINNLYTKSSATVDWRLSEVRSADYIVFSAVLLWSITCYIVKNYMVHCQELYVTLSSIYRLSLHSASHVWVTGYPLFSCTLLLSS